MANALFGTSYTDLCYGYNAFWADILPVLDLPDISLSAPPAGGMLWGDGFEIETVLNCRVAAAGMKITEVPSMERERIFGADQPAHLRRRHARAAHAGRRAPPGRAQAGRAGADGRAVPRAHARPVGSRWSRQADPAPPVRRSPSTPRSSDGRRDTSHIRLALEEEAS